MVIGSQFLQWSWLTNSGFINDDEAPVSIKNFNGLPKGADISIYGSVCPCLFISMYPVGSGRHLFENFHCRQFRYYRVVRMGWIVGE